jgi:hypothetical protein
MSNITDEAYARLQKILAKSDSNKAPIIADITLTKAEKSILFSTLYSKLTKNASIPEYHAELIINSLINVVDDFLGQKLQAAKQAASNKNLNSPVFRRSED